MYLSWVLFCMEICVVRCESRRRNPVPDLSLIVFLNFVSFVVCGLYSADLQQDSKEERISVHGPIKSAEHGKKVLQTSRLTDRNVSSPEYSEF